MPSNLSRDLYHETAARRVGTASIIHKFGRNPAVGTTFVPISIGGVYQTPQAAAATTLRVKAGGDANDTAAGSGAREITLQGLDDTGAEVIEAVATAGASASSATTATFTRLHRAYVSKSGTYATSAAGSHAGDIVIENGAGGTDWLTIDSTDFPKGQSEVGIVSIPAGYKAYLKTFFVYTDSSKTSDFILFKRESILDAAAPYQGMRAQFVGQSTGENVPLSPSSPLGPFVGPCDLGFMAKVGVGTASVGVDFELMLEKR